MRRLSTEETFFYFQDYFSNANNMVLTFASNKHQDKNNEFVNKKYLIQKVYGFYDYSDIMELLKYREEQQNTIIYAQQLVVDIESLFVGIPVKYKCKGKLAQLIGITQQQMGVMNISYNTALKIIKNIEDKIKSMSFEGIQDLKMRYERVINE